MVDLNPNYLFVRTLVEVYLHYEHIIECVQLRYKNLRAQISPEGISDINSQESQYLAEAKLEATLALYSTIEAVFKIDLIVRNVASDTLTDALSNKIRDFTKKDKEGSIKIEDISIKMLLKEWESHYKASNQGLSKTIQDLKESFTYRNWLAHGRIDDPPTGDLTDFKTIYIHTQELLKDSEMSSLVSNFNRATGRELTIIDTD